MTTTFAPAARVAAAADEPRGTESSSSVSSTADVLAWCARDAQQHAEYQEFLDSLVTSGERADTAPTSPPPWHTAPAARPSLAHLDELLDEVADVESRIATLHARRARLVATVGRAVAGMDADLVDDTDPTARASSRARRHELAERAAVAELATVLHVGEHAAGTVLDHARTLTTRASGHPTRLAQTLRPYFVRPRRDPTGINVATHERCSPTPSNGIWTPSRPMAKAIPRDPVRARHAHLVQRDVAPKVHDEPNDENGRWIRWPRARSR